MTATNRWAGPCDLCGHTVAAGEGVAERDGADWLVRHADQEECGDPDTAPHEGQRPNRFPGTCARCGEHVDTDEGIVYPDGERWVLEHSDC
jgi:hypothetical protein